MSLIIAALAVTGCMAGAEVFVGPGAPERGLGIVQNSHFETGGLSYADHWRPLPGAARIHRKQRETGEHSLYLELRETGDGGVIQTVDLPARRTLSLRTLATCHAENECAVVVTLTREADGVVLAEVTVDGIERGVLAEAFETGRGGPAQLMVRVVGEEGGRALIDRVSIAKPVAARHARSPDYAGADLLLATGAGLRVDADFEPSLLPQAARMLQEAIEDVTGAPTTDVGAAVHVSVDQPPATEWPERESYHLNVGESGVTITAPAEQGAMWAMMTLIDLIRPEPSGGDRILAIDVSDEPALPWRIATAADFHDPANTARKLARLKLNMAIVPWEPGGCSTIVTELRSLGIEPVLRIDAGRTDDTTGAMRDAVTRLAARYVFATQPSDEVAAFAKQHRGAVEVMAPAGASAPEAWPEGIVALLAADDDDADRLRQWFGAGVPYALGDLDPAAGMAVPIALERSAAGDICMGVVLGRAGLGSEVTRQAADLAWGSYQRLRMRRPRQRLSRRGRLESGIAGPIGVRAPRPDVVSRPWNHLRGVTRLSWPYP